MMNPFSIDCLSCLFSTQNMTVLLEGERIRKILLVYRFDVLLILTNVKI